MRFSKYILQSIRKNKGKYFAVIISTCISVGVFLTLSIFSSEMQNSLNQFFFMNNQTLFVTQKDSVFQPVPSESLINESIENQIDKIPGVTGTFRILTQQYGNQITTGFISDYIVGIDKVGEFSLFNGGTIKNGEWNITDNKIVIGSMALGGNHSVNDIITIKGKQFVVSGILEMENSLYNHLIFMNYKTMQNIFGLQGKCSMIYVICNQNGGLTSIKNIISIIAGIQVMDSNDVDTQFNGMFSYIQIGEMVTGLIPLIISVQFMFAIVAFIIRSRYREFGLLQVLGMSNSRIMLFFFSEILIIISIGFLLGVIFGYFLFVLSYNYVNNYVLTVSIQSAEYYFNSILISKLGIFQVYLITTGLNLLVSSIPALSIYRYNLSDTIRKG